MNFQPLGIQGAWVAGSPVWDDYRGFFCEWFKYDEISASTGIDFIVKQANFSLSDQGVIRGIHYSLIPGGQSKWITCVSGSVTDVVVDLRIDSPTFKKVEYVDLRQDDGKAVLVGPGLGHGFYSKENESGIAYLLNSPYNPEHEYEISPNDPELAIKWAPAGLEEESHVISAKDRSAPTLRVRREQGQLPQIKPPNGNFTVDQI
jgi:dTDP-4-dehydrorhamnose 3,5-epimerase